MEILKKFHFFQTGSLLSENDNINTLQQSLPNIEIKQLSDRKLKISTLLKILIKIVEYLQE